MMPIVFWASFDPWARAMYVADKICSFLKRSFMWRGLARTKTLRMTIIRPKPIARPRIGDENNGTRILAAN